MDFTNSGAMLTFVCNKGSETRDFFFLATLHPPFENYILDVSFLASKVAEWNQLAVLAVVFQGGCEIPRGFRRQAPSWLLQEQGGPPLVKK